MNRISLVSILVLLIAASALGQTSASNSQSAGAAKNALPLHPGSPSAAANRMPAVATLHVHPAPADELQDVLAQMNQASAHFKNLQADFVWDNFTKLVKETDTQTGQAYFRRKEKTLDAFLNIIKPPKQVLYKDGRISIYEPKINRITIRDVSKNKSDVDAFMNLGLGGRGDALAASFEIEWRGWETVDGTKTAKLELTGKTPSLRKAFSKAVLWIDPERDIALKQQFLQESGDYRLTRYSNPRVNGELPHDVFKLKTTGKPEIVDLH